MADSDTKPPAAESADTKPAELRQLTAAAAVRKEKRQKWWHDNVEKRLNAEAAPGAAGLEGTADKSDAKLPGKDEKARRFKRRDQKQKSGGENDDDDDGNKGGLKKAKRFAVFVGQIPFDANEADVRALFDNIAKPGVLKDFRWKTNPKTKKFSGFAFVEFNNKGSYLRAFELHHALVKGRPINVEATSAGGKKSGHRKEAIKKETENRQKQAKQALERKARADAKRKKPLPEAAEPSAEEKAEGTAEKKIEVADSILSNSTIPAKRKLDSDSSGIAPAWKKPFGSSRKFKAKLLPKPEGSESAKDPEAAKDTVQAKHEDASQSGNDGAFVKPEGINSGGKGSGGPAFVNRDRRREFPVRSPGMRGGFTPGMRGGFTPGMRGGFTPAVRGGFAPRPNFIKRELVQFSAVASAVGETSRTHIKFE